MCHPTKGAMGFSQHIHPELITKIHELVQTGVTDPTVVQRLLRSHVRSQMHTNPPDPNDRSYFPMVDDVRNHVNRAKQSLKLSIIDQENAALKVDQWKALCAEAKFLFRPYTCSSEKEEHTETTLLWVHQEPWQTDDKIRQHDCVNGCNLQNKKVRAATIFLSAYEQTRGIAS